MRGFDIRNSRVQGRDIAFNTLTGSDINESGLGQVPSALAADTRRSAAGGETPARRNYRQAGGRAS